MRGLHNIIGKSTGLPPGWCEKGCNGGKKPGQKMMLSPIEMNLMHLKSWICFEMAAPESDGIVVLKVYNALL